jgi:hypothetical protein
MQASEFSDAQKALIWNLPALRQPTLLVVIIEDDAKPLTGLSSGNAL